MDFFDLQKGTNKFCLKEPGMVLSLTTVTLITLVYLAFVKSFL